MAVLTERYNPNKVRQINVHGDGTPWIQALQKLILYSRLVPDGYHPEKE